MFVKSFNEISKDDVKLVGGKGASLGEMTRVSIPIPPGFVVTTEGFKKNIEEEVLKAFDKLGAEWVAVRSSATAEDSSQASWAGQLETYLNITKKNLINKIRECWNSIQSERAIDYASQQNLSAKDLFVAVVVQKMIESKASGVIFTTNPISRDSNEMMIEAGFGLGELLAQGLITPDNFVVNKDTLEIKSRDVQIQDTMLIFKNGENKEISIPENKKNEHAIPDEIVGELVEIGKRIEAHYGKPQDIEWSIDDQDKIWILQSRPITTLD